MELIYKTMYNTGRELYLHYPCENQRTPFKTNAITIFLDEVNKEICDNILDTWGLRKFSEETETIISFPVPPAGGWNYNLDPNREDDVKLFPLIQEGMNKPDSLPPEVNEFGIPLFSTMLSNWHPIHDSRYLIGVGSGANMVLTLAACIPDNIAAVLAIGGKMSDEALNNATNAPVPVCFVDADPKAVEYFNKSNKVNETVECDCCVTGRNINNPLRSVTVMNDGTEVNEEFILGVCKNLFFKVRRPKCGPHGTVDARFDFPTAGFECFINDARLKNGKEHTWFTHVPTCAKENPDKKVPMMIFCHGGSDNPHEAAEMTHHHELGEKEGFITVFPWGSDTIMWNAQMVDTPYNDDEFILDLIDYMVENYPVDPTRVYISGFSAGGAMAQTFAMTHPDRIAGLCHIDAHWPGSPGADRGGKFPINYEEHIPIMRALALKEKYDYRMPIWYIYGNKDVAFPVEKGKNQQHQYDFWKKYNNIEVKETPDEDTPELAGCGVIGDIRERIDDPLHIGLYYDVHRFFTKDEKPENYYNFCMMHDKDHDIAHMDSILGWNYVKQFRRNPDGSISRVEE